MFARVARLREFGALCVEIPPPVDAWVRGIFEFSSTPSGGHGSAARSRRLVLRDARANPDKGVIFELWRPELVDVRHPYLRFRGVEAVTLGAGQIASITQDWLVELVG